VIVVRVKVSRGIEPFYPMGSTVRTLVNRPMVVWTLSDQEACLFWSCIDVIVVRV
jgi:hypothetical protein